jgi:outer membrane protein insertion porin family
MTETDDAKKVVNFTMVFDQEKQYFVRRIEFSGNTTTRDKVIRREILLDEGQVYNNRLWELSILRLNQLGYFDAIKPENAELKRNVKAGTVDINLKVKEKGKQSISFSGGVSGIAGSFVGLSYQTNNFLGLGETLTFSVQFGNIQRNIQFGFTEPYLFDRPLSTGFTIFLNRFDYNTARQEGLLLNQQVAINPALQENYNTDSKGSRFSRAIRCGSFRSPGWGSPTDGARRTSRRSASRRRCCSKRRNLRRWRDLRLSTASARARLLRRSATTPSTAP